MLSNRIFAALMLAFTIITFHPARMQYTIPYVIQVLFENDSYNRTINPDRLSLVAVSPFFMKNWDIGARTEVRESQHGTLTTIDHFTNLNRPTKFVCMKNICSNNFGRDVFETLLFFFMIFFSIQLFKREKSLLF